MESRGAGYRGLPKDLAEVVRREFEHPAPAVAMLDRFFRQRRYDRATCSDLIATGRGENGGGWPLRQLATLLLEHLVLTLEDDLQELRLLLTRLGLAVTRGGGWRLRDSVLAEGFSTTEPAPFFVELKRRLGRLDRLHTPLRQARVTAAALRDFIRSSRRDCRLTLGRYLFSPEEIAERILADVRTSRGVVSPVRAESPEVRTESDHALEQLPEFESALVRRLLEGSRIYWVAEGTSARPNSLVECPTSTVVLVVKSPGSDREIEIKRAGKRGGQPLGVVFARNGERVTPSHRLDGGSMVWGLHYEAAAAARIGAIFRRVHGTDAPISTIHAISTIHTVPAASGEQYIAPYFTDPLCFGEGFDAMRAAMAECNEAFRYEHDRSFSGLPHEIGRTLQFLNYTAPGQAILTGTSSFRLDRLAAELGAAGLPPGEDGTADAEDPDQARRRVDEVLDEILGRYTPPGVPFRDRRSYAAAALALPANRARADQVFRSLMEQIGTFWGTVLAVRGVSHGESFVARNVGLRSVFRQGDWRVEIRFMDHDHLQMTGRHDGGAFSPRASMSPMGQDESFIFGMPEVRQGELDYLARIYAVGAERRGEAEAWVRSAARRAYYRTQEAVTSDPAFRKILPTRFIRRLRDWDTVVRDFLAAGPGEADRKAWQEAATARLTAKGYGPVLAAQYPAFVEFHERLVGRLRFLFDPPTDDAA